MSLSCGCGELDLEPGGIRHYYPEDFEELKTSTRKRCTSCKTLIEIGAVTVPFDWFKVPEHEVEINIYGEDGQIQRARTYLCETCGEIYLNLITLGYCLNNDDDMREMLKEYHLLDKAERDKKHGHNLDKQ